MFYIDENEESFKIKHEELDIKDEIINDPPVEKEKPSTIKKITRKDFYKCKECNYSANDLGWLNKHLIKVHQNRDQVQHYECYNCGDVFTNKSKLSLHIRKELNIKKQLKCSKCEYSTFFTNHFKQHYLYKHTADEEIEWFKCTECDYKGKSKSALKGHQEKHSLTKNFKCKDCIFSTRRKHCLKEHIRRKHQTEDNIERFHCIKCDYNTISKPNLFRHMKITHGIKNNIKTKEDLFKHIKITHGNEKYKCNECEYYTVYRHNFKRHIMCKHTPDEKSIYYQCEKCDFRSKNQSWFSKHKKTHLGECFPCDRCDYKGKTKAVLQRHLNYKHLKRNAVKCKECPYTASTTTYLKNHVKYKHTTENEIQYFYCGYCTHKAKIKNDLRTHIKNVHLKDQSSRFQCPDCLFSTRYKYVLEKHVMAKHTPEDKKKYFYCDKCDYKSTWPGNVKLHDYVGHTHPDLIKWHQCPYCETKMKLKSEITKHIKCLHPEKMEKKLEK